MSLELFSNNIKVDKKPKKNIIDKLDDPIIYSSSLYGINNYCTGKKVKIAILDTGCPKHKDIKNIGDRVNFCEKNVATYDNHGHSTMISGIIGAKNIKNIIGVAPDAELQFGRIVDNNGDCSYNSLVAGVLWAIVKEVDIIVIALGSSYDYSILRDAVKKARDYGICVFAAAGDKISDHIDYPANYEYTISTGFMTRKKINNEILRKKIDLILPNKALYTTYLDNKYTKVTGSSISTAFYAGMAAILIEQYKKEQRKDIPNEVYNTLKKIF
jgi:subtilisin family serine protease